MGNERGERQLRQDVPVDGAHQASSVFALGDGVDGGAVYQERKGCIGGKLFRRKIRISVFEISSLRNT